MDEDLLSWDVVDRSLGGHERRRRVLWRMSEPQAREWAHTHQLCITQAIAGIPAESGVTLPGE